ncbi:MAG: hypothetical protein V2I40_01865 [Desulfobacteraceae bacterium]|nr:hypothetical protein [Desulfobacteraceae bacterium]
MVWTRMLAVALGHEITAVLAVVAAFFCGMALGAWLLDSTVSRSARPGRWYAFLELSIGLWAFILIFLLPWANNLAPMLTGINPSAVRHWAVAFLLPFFLLLPATFAMGATLPAMERLLARLQRNGWSVGGLYAANTFGAVAGTMLSSFVIAPAIGFRATTGILAMVNILCAIATRYGAAKGESERPPIQAKQGAGMAQQRLLIILAATGLLGIGYEVLAIRVVSQVLENTIFSFASLLAVYLLGTASGAAIYQWVAPRHKFEMVLTFLLEATAFFCGIGIIVLSQAESIFLGLREWVGGGVFGAMIGEIGLAGVVFFLPTLGMGATFSHLAQGARRRNGGVGRALCVNTLGASAAPLVFGVVILPHLGPKWALMLIALGYLVLIPTRQWRHWMPALVPLLLVGILWFHADNFHVVKLPAGSRVAAHRDGVMAAVTVVEDSRKDYYLKVNNKFMMGGTASVFSDGRQGHIPLLLHPHPKRALFLGLGTGATFAASADHPKLVADGVELVPEIVEMLPYFEKATGKLDLNDRLHLHIADARRFVKTSRETYDVIVADLFHPARDGAGFLYTVEHYDAIRALLATDGLFCQWLPLYQMDLDVLRTITRTFLHSFPHGVGFMATYSLKTPIIGLIASRKPLSFPTDYLKNRLANDPLEMKLQQYRLHDIFSIFGGFMAGTEDLANFAGSGPLNTDDRPLVVFQAPHFAYDHNEPAYVRLLDLVDHLNPSPDQILLLNGKTHEKMIGQRLSAYWEARNKFLYAGVGVRQTSNVQDMLVQIQDPLLEILAESPDFRPAYDPLVFMARRLREIDPEAAEKLLLELEEVDLKRCTFQQ